MEKHVQKSKFSTEQKMERVEVVTVGSVEMVKVEVKITVLMKTHQDRFWRVVVQILDVDGERGCDGARIVALVLSGDAQEVELLTFVAIHRARRVDATVLINGETVERLRVQVGIDPVSGGSGDIWEGDCFNNL